jgi:Ras-related protein Rab-7A
LGILNLRRNRQPARLNPNLRNLKSMKRRQPLKLWKRTVRRAKRTTAMRRAKRRAMNKKRLHRNLSLNLNRNLNQPNLLLSPRRMKKTRKTKRTKRTRRTKETKRRMRKRMKRRMKRKEMKTAMRVMSPQRNDSAVRQALEEEASEVTVVASEEVTVVVSEEVTVVASEEEIVVVSEEVTGVALEEEVASEVVTEEDLEEETEVASGVAIVAEDAEDSEVIPEEAVAGLAEEVASKFSLVMEDSTPKKKLLKVILLGDSGVGKSSIIERFVSEGFQPYLGTTVSPDFAVRDMKIQETDCTLQIWDTAGQERFFSLCTSYFRGTDAVGLVFDLSNTTDETFEKLDRWRTTFFDIVQVATPDNFSMVLIGNKNDVARPNTDVYKAAAAKATAWVNKNHNVRFDACSAKTGDDVYDAFMHLGEAAFNFSKQTSVSSEAVVIKKTKTSSGCCS